MPTRTSLTWTNVSKNIEHRIVHTIYVRNKLIIPPRLASAYMDCFHLRGSPMYVWFRRNGVLYKRKVGPKYRIVGVWPPEHWDAASNVLRITRQQSEFLGIVWLSPFKTKNYRNRPCVELILGFDRKLGKPWCHATPTCKYYDPQRGSKICRKTLERQEPYTVDLPLVRVLYAEYQEDTTDPTVEVPFGSAFRIEVHMKAGLWDDKISCIVDISSLRA
jgi:hypothetical protein